MNDSPHSKPTLDAIDAAILAASEAELEAEYRALGEEPSIVIGEMRSVLQMAISHHKTSPTASAEPSPANGVSNGRIASDISQLPAGTRVRLVGDPQEEGRFLDISVVAGHQFARIQFSSGTRRIPSDQLEPVPEAPEEPVELLRTGRLGSPDRLRKVLTHARLTGRLADVLYSMESTNTQFLAHQFKPVLKMLSSPTGGLLIADEVGLGKTIEAGLIWTELKARYEYRRLIVVCPKDLLTKWETELSNKFGVEARIVSPQELLTILQDPSRSSSFVAVCSLQALQPPSDWEYPDSRGYERASARLARFLRDQAGEDPLFDLLIIDEAHHLRNPQTQRNQLGRLLRPLAHHKVFLSATPIHLRNRDLFSLLSLLDPETFRFETALQQILEANRPLIEAREATLRGSSKADILMHLHDAVSHPLLLGTSQLPNVISEVEGSADPLSFSARSRIAGRIDQINLLANVVNRTRRRDVQELRVIRNVAAFRATMTDQERFVYDRITQQIEKYAWSCEMGAGFLLSMPQRLLASSIPASMEHWRARSTDLQIEDDMDEDFLNGADHDGELNSLRTTIAELCRELPLPEKLAESDSKFSAFYSVIDQYLTDAPSEKIVIFSTFRATLEYLDRRLRKCGYQTRLLHGGIKNRDTTLKEFEEEPKIRILLASEIGSEGLDLQFCRALVNYDLPWNPMRVEQRIGRIDRIGQAAESISIFNLLYADTIDDRIYGRLYERLDLCRRALGDFEAVLGDEIRKLQVDLLARPLSSAQQIARIEQTRQAIEYNRRETENLESEAAALIAHGDHVLRAIHAAHDLNRWIGPRDLGRYLRDSLGGLFPGSSVRELQTEDSYEIRLTPEARSAYQEWLIERRYPQRTMLEREYGAVECRFGRPATGRRPSRVEFITQSHPFVRFVANKIAQTEASRLRPAVAVRVNSEAFGSSIKPGVYVGLAMIWSFGGPVEQERIAYAAMDCNNQRMLDEEVAEKLMITSADTGVHWPGADVGINFDVVADKVEGVLIRNLMERFVEEGTARRAEQSDRMAIQLRTLQMRFGEEEQRLLELIEQQRRGPGRLVAANEERLRRLRQRAKDRRAQIEYAAHQTAQSEQLAIVLATVV